MLQIIIGISISSKGAVLFLPMPGGDIGEVDTLRMTRHRENVIIEFRLLSGSQGAFADKSRAYWRKMARAYWQAHQGNCEVEDTEDGSGLQTVDLFDLTAEKIEPPTSNRGVSGDSA